MHRNPLPTASQASGSELILHNTGQPFTSAEFAGIQVFSPEEEEIGAGVWSCRGPTKLNLAVLGRVVRSLQVLRIGIWQVLISFLICVVMLFVWAIDVFFETAVIIITNCNVQMCEQVLKTNKKNPTKNAICKNI